MWRSRSMSRDIHTRLWATDLSSLSGKASWRPRHVARRASHLWRTDGWPLGPTASTEAERCERMKPFLDLGKAADIEFDLEVVAHTSQSNLNGSYFGRQVRLARGVHGGAQPSPL